MTHIPVPFLNYFNYDFLGNIFWTPCLVAQLCLTVCDPVDCSLPGSSVRGIHQARILEWVAVPSSRGSSQPRGRAQVSLIARGFFTV